MLFASDAHVVDAVGLLVALRATQRVGPPTSIRLTGLVERGTGWSAAERARLHDALGATQVGAVVEGHATAEPMGAQRWLAWFPRPLGPMHAISVPSPVPGLLLEGLGTALGAPRDITIRAHLAVRTWQAELLQALASSASMGRVDDRLGAWAARGAATPDPRARWACVVEVVDAESRLVRGWAHGVDRGLLAGALAASSGDLVSGGDEAAEVLDSLALPPRLGGAGLRWSVGQPAVVGP